MLAKSSPQCFVNLEKYLGGSLSFSGSKVIHSVSVVLTELGDMRLIRNDIPDRPTDAADWWCFNFLRGISHTILTSGLILRREADPYDIDLDALGISKEVYFDYPQRKNIAIVTGQPFDELFTTHRAFHQPELHKVFYAPESIKS